MTIEIRDVLDGDYQCARCGKQTGDEDELAYLVVDDEQEDEEQYVCQECLGAA